MAKESTNPHQSRSQVKARLERAGIIPTQQRLEIASVILSHPRHLSADQLLALVNQGERGVSKATVYNTLGLFIRKGIVRQVLVDPNRVFFDSNVDEHCHIYNEDTGDLLDVPKGCLSFGDVPPLPVGTTLVDIDVIIRVRNADR